MKSIDYHNHKKQWDTRGRKGTITKQGYRSFCRVQENNIVRKYEHRKVWEEAYGSIPKGYIIHHKDGNKLNNSLENLTLMSMKEHSKMHAELRGLGKDRKGISPTNKTPIDIISKIKKLRQEGNILSKIVAITGLSYPTVQKYSMEEK